MGCRNAWTGSNGRAAGARARASWRGAGDWVALGKRLFDRVLREGGVWHLFGHSWEIEQRGLWDGLAELTRYVARRPGVTYLTNGGLAAARGRE